ncbi:MAG: tetratricopeptide repeat protein [Polyangiaceae bacterium]
MQPDAKTRRVPLRLETLAAALEQPLQNEAEILDVLVTAAQRSQDSADLWDQLDAAAVRDDRLAELAFAYERLSRDKKLAKLPPHTQADILARIGAFFADAFGDPDGAEVYLQQAIGLSPAHATAFAKLEALLIRKQEGLRLSDLYAAAAPHKTEKRDQITMLRRALELCESFGGSEDDDRRIKLFHQLMKLDPSDAKVRKDLEEAYLRAGKVADLAKLLEQTLHGELPPAEARAARERLIEVYVERLREPEKTIAHAEELLKAHPDSEPARKAAEALLGHKVLAPRAAAALGSAHERLGRYADAARCIAIEVDHFRGARRVDAQKKLAALRFQKLGDLPGALALYEQVVVLDPSDDEVRDRYRSLSAALDKSLDATRVLTRALAGAKDANLRAKIGLEIGEIFVELGDAKKAKVALQQVLDAGGGDAEVLRATRALAAIATEARDSKALALALRKLAELEADPEERGRAAAELGQLYETDLRDPAGAIDAWRKVLGTSREDEALGALARLYEVTGARKELAQVLERRADSSAGPDVRRAALLQVAELRAALGDRGAAIEALRKVVSVFGPGRDATQRLVPLLEQERRWEDLASALDADAAGAPEEERAAISSRLGQLRLARLGDIGGAIRAFGAALAVDRFDKNARLSLEKILSGPAVEAARAGGPPAATIENRLAAAKLLEDVYRAEGATAAVVRVLDAKSALLGTPEERLRALVEAATVMEREVGDPKRAFDLAARGLKEAAASVVVAVPDWLARVERLAEKGADKQKLAEALASALGDHDVNHPALCELAKKTGDALVVSGDVARALPILRRALAFEPGSPDLVQKIDALLKEQGSPEERVALFRTLLQKAQEPDRKRELLHAIAAIQRRDLGDVTGAIETYRRILGTDPDDATAQDALLEAYAETGQSDALYTELGARLYRAHGEERARLLVRLAEVAASAGWSQRAAEHYHEAIAAGASLGEERLTHVENLALSLGDGRLVRLVLARRVEMAASPEEEAQWLERLAQHDADVLHDRAAASLSFKRAARLVEEAASDEDRARKLYERALATAQDDRDAASKLAGMYERTSAHWSSLPAVHDVLIRTAPTQEDAVVALLAFEPAAIKARASGAFSSAIAAVGKKHGPLSQDLWKQVQAALARVLASDVERQDEAAAVFRAMVENAPPESKREREAFEAFLDTAPDTLSRRADKRWLFDLRARTAPETERAPVLFRWACDEERAGDPTMALKLVERSLALAPDNDEALAARGRLLLATGDVNGAVRALLARRDRAEGDARVAVEKELMTLLFEQLGSVGEALDTAARILEHAPTDRDALDTAERALAAEEFAERAADVLARAAETAVDPEESAAILRRIVASEAFSTTQLAPRRAAWVLRLLDCLSERPEEALEVALSGTSASPFEWSLWERAERLARDLSKPDTVAAAYRAAAFGEGASGADLESFEELGRRAVEFHEEWFDEPENVAALLRRMVERAPTPGWAFERLKLVYNAGEQWSELFGLYDQALAATSDPDLRLQLLEDAAGTARDLAGDPERLMSYLEQILPLRKDARTRSALERLYERHGRKDKLVALLTAQLGEMDAAAALATRMRIANLAVEAGDSEAAYDTVEAVLAADPEKPEAYEILERILRATQEDPPSDHGEDLLSARRRAAALLEKRYRAQNRTADLIRVLEIELWAARTPGGKIPRLREIVKLRLSSLGDEAGALDDVAALLLLEPGDNEHKDTLVRLSERVGKFDRLAATLAEAAERSPDPRRRVQLYSEAAAVHRDKIGDLDSAIALQKAILPLAEGDREMLLAAAGELARLLSRTGQKSELCDTLERLAQLATEPAERVGALREVARIADRELGDLDRAAKAQEAILVIEPRDAEALDGLVELLSRSARPEALAAALMRRAAARTGDAARADLLQAAAIAEDHVADFDLATGLYARVRSTFGRDAETGDALIRLYERGEQWEELAKLLEEEAAADGSVERTAPILCKLGDLHAQRTGRIADAIASYALACEQGSAGATAGLEALVTKLDPQSKVDRPSFVAAVHALARARNDRGEWRELVRLTDARIAAADTKAERIAILHETASHWERQGGDATAAFDATLRAFEIEPSAELATELRRLVNPAQRHATLAERLPSALQGASGMPPAAVRDLHWDLARHFRRTGEDADLTEQLLRRALAAEPTNVLLHTELCDALRARGTPSRALVSALLALADLVDPLTPLREAATHAVDALQDTTLAREVTERLLAAAVAELPAGGSDALSAAASATMWALRTLIDIARAAGDAARVVELGERAATLPLPASDVRALRVVAAKHASSDRAIRIYAELFERDPADAEVGQSLFDLHEARDDRDALIAIRGQQIDSSADAAERARLRLDLARRLARADRGDAAIVVLRTSLAESPGDDDAVTALGDLLAVEGRHADLAALWEDEAARRESQGARDGAATLWTRAAVTAETKLRDTLRAIKAYRRAAAFDSPEALRALARLYAASGQHGEAARAMEALATLAAPSERPGVLLALADTLVEAGEPERARRRLESALAEVPDPAPLRARLRSMYRAAGDFAPLADMMAEDAARSTDPAEKMALLREAAHIRLERKEPALAVPLLSSALELDSDDLGLRLLWCRALSESGRRDDALASLRALIDAYGGRRPKERALVHHELARVLLAGGEKSRAMGELDVALRIDPAHPEILQALAKLSLAEGQLERAHRTFRALLRGARRPPGGAPGDAPPPGGMSRTEILCELSDIAARQGDETRSIEYMESAFDAARESAGEGQRFLRALAARSRPKDLARALTAEIERATGGEAARLWSELAALHEGPLASPTEAAAARLSALTLAPDVAAVHDAAIAACEKSGDLGRYARAVADLVDKSEAAGGSDRTVDLLIRLGRALEREGGSLARAVTVYQRAEALLQDRPLDPRLQILWKALERCFTEENEPDLVAQVIEKRIRVASGVERIDALYGLADLRLRKPTTYDEGLDLLVEATANDPDEDRAEAALRRAITTERRSARAPKLLELFAREKGRKRALLDALLAMFETEPLGEEAMREAVALANELGDPALAQELLRRAVERDEAGEGLDPGLRVWARVTLSNLREAAGELAEAAHLREAAARHAEPAEERALLLRVARDAAGPLDDLARAARTYEDLRLREPADREVWEPLADVYRRLGDAARLAALIEDTVPLIDSPDERGRLRLERARLVLSQDEARAIDLLREVLEEDPSQAEAARLLAGVFERQGRLDDLADLLRGQLDAAKDREDARAVTELSMRLGALLEKRGDEHGALDVYHRTLDWDPQSKEALRAVLRLSVELDNSVDLGDALEKLLDVEEGPEAATLAVRLAELKAAHGDTPGAERALESGFRKCPADERLLSLLAERYAARGAFSQLAKAHVARSKALPALTDRVDALCRAAEVLREKAHDPAGAADVLEQALALDARERDILLALIDACEALGQPERAIAAATTALAASPEDAWLYRSRASLEESAGRFDLAVKDLAHAVEKSGGGYGTEYAMALDRAIERCAGGRALPEDLPERELRIRLAEHSARAGDLERARAQLSDLLRKDGKDKAALRSLAALEDGAGNWDAASAVYRRLISLEEGEALSAAALRLANACERAERLGDARGGLERALRAAPGNAAVRERLRQLYEATGAKVELSIMIAEDARAEAEPSKRGAALLRAGRLAIEAGDGPRSLQILDEARQVSPELSEIPLAYAQALATSGRAGEARALLTQAAASHRGKRSKQLGAIHLALAHIEQHANNHEAARESMLRAFDNDPQNADLAMELGNFALDRGDVDAAARAFRAVTLLRTTAIGASDGATTAMKAAAYHRLALIANAQGDRRKARFMVEKALAEDPSLAEARALLEALR